MPERYKVLLVEDDEDDRMAFERFGPGLIMVVSGLGVILSAGVSAGIGYSMRS